MPSRRRPRQAKLTFEPLPLSSPASAVYNQQIRERAAAVSIDGSPSRSSRPSYKRRKIDNHFTAGNSSSASGAHEDCEIIILDDSQSDVDEKPASRTRSDRNRIETDSSDDMTASSPLFTREDGSFFRKSQDLKRSRRGEQRRSRDGALLDNDGNSGGEGPQPDRRAADNLVDFGTSSDDSDVVITPGRKRVVVAPEHDDEDDDEDELPRSSTQRRLQRRGVRRPSMRADNASPENECDSHGAVSYIDQGSKGHELTQEEQQELQDDLEGLQSSSSEEDRRPRQPTAQQKRQAALARLKRSRAKAQDHTSKVIDLDDETELREDMVADNYPDDSDEVLSQKPELPMSSAKDIFDADEGDDEFLDDGDDTIGVPDDLPLEFTRYASMRPKELFTFVVEWMVQKKLNPGFNGTDEIYILAFQKLDDEIKGLAGSKFESAAWKSDFLYALRARPQLAVDRMDRNDPDLMWKEKCDACNRSGHVPTYEIQFQGRPYHHESLEYLEDESEDDSGNENDDVEETDKVHRDVRGNEILPQSHSFYVGKFCMANAETAHALQHWRFHLYEWVVEHLEEAGHLTDAQIVRRDRWGEPKRRRYANKVVDQMTERGKVKELYRDFKDEVSRAREAKHARGRASSE